MKINITASDNCWWTPLGLVLGVAVTPASTTERDGAQVVLGRVLGWFTWLRILWVDGGCTGETFAQIGSRGHQTFR